MIEKIANFVKENSSTNLTTLSASDDLLTTGILDSMAVMRLINFIEDTIDIKIPPEDLLIENFISIEAMQDYIEGRNG